MRALLADIQPGTVIASRYEVVQRLGAGGMGLVLKVRDKLLDDHVMALKLVYPHLISKDSSFARFRSEVSITRRLSHPAIVQTFGFGRLSDGLPYVAMEYVPGRTLKAFIADENKGMPFAVIEKILVSIGDALAFAHARGVIHRDLKPENILVREDGVVKIADFGLAQMFREESRLTKTGAIVGTAFYMPPEQFGGEPLTRRSDIYSLGILAYELAAGVLPFQGATLYELAEQHLAAPLPPFRRVRIPLGISISCSAAPPRTPRAVSARPMKCCYSYPVSFPSRRRKSRRRRSANASSCRSGRSLWVFGCCAKWSGAELFSFSQPGCSL